MNIVITILWIILFVALTGGIYYYVGRRLIRPFDLATRMKLIAWSVVTLIYLVHISMVLLVSQRIESPLTDRFAWIAFITLGLFSSVLALLLIRDLPLGMMRLAQKLRTLIKRKTFQGAPVESRLNPDRRNFLLRSTNYGIFGAAVVMSGYGLYESRRRPILTSLNLSIPKLPEAFNGFRIVQFSDLHVGPTIKRSFVESVVADIQSLQPDLIVFTGDMVDGSVAWLQDDVAPLRALAAPHGVWFVTGNHEYYSGVTPWMKEVSRLGMNVLHNEHQIISQDGNRIVLAGVTDWSGGGFSKDHTSNPAQAIHNAPEDAIRILLAHQPKTIFEAARVGFDVQLSGHTHGGQFFPWNYLAMLNQPYITGLQQHGNTQIYINRGTGYWGPPLRVGIPSEITLIILSS